MTTAPCLPGRAPSGASGELIPCRVPFAAIPRATWDRLASVSPAATPFSRWTFHRAWWDAYGVTAHEQYLVCVRPGASASAEQARDGTVGDSADIVGIVPLMHRHEVEPDDAATATVLRRPCEPGTCVRPDAKAVFMGASYHADYATLLCAPEDIEGVADTVARSCRQPTDFHGEVPWDVIDLRRLREIDPSLPALERAFRRYAATEGWEVCVEQEDVCPVTTFTDADWEAFLATLDKKARHEIRRKVRRAEKGGEIRFVLAPLDVGSVERFIELHQARWGDEGLFPPNPGGDRSRVFLRRLTELEAAEGPNASLQLGQAYVGDRLIFVTVGFDDGVTCFYYNAGMDPTARELSPGVTGTAAYVRDRLNAGRRRFDFLRGDETYKYEWGAVDEPVFRLLIQRSRPA